MKKELIVSIIVTVFLIIVGLFFVQNYKLQQAKFALYSAQVNTAQSNGIESNSEQNKTDALATSLSIQDVATHSTASDCWIIINNKVYNVTNYLRLHPGGSNRIIPYCGQDATQAFLTQGGEGSHSSQAYADLVPLYIGDISSADANNTVSVTNPTNTNPQLSPGSKINTPDTNQVSGVFLSTQTVATHNIASDCWLIVSGKVYNVTNYINLHPGGSNRIIPYCGQDATQAFLTQGGGGSHSSLAFADLAQLYIGDVGTQTSATNLQPNPAPTPTAVNSSDEHEYEDD